MHDFICTTLDTDPRIRSRLEALRMLMAESDAMAHRTLMSVSKSPIHVNSATITGAPNASAGGTTNGTALRSQSARFFEGSYAVPATNASLAAAAAAAASQSRVHHFHNPHTNQFFRVKPPQKHNTRNRSIVPISSAMARTNGLPPAGNGIAMQNGAGVASMQIGAGVASMQIGAGVASMQIGAGVAAMQSGVGVSTMQNGAGVATMAPLTPTLQNNAVRANGVSSSTPTPTTSAATTHDDVLQPLHWLQNPDLMRVGGGQLMQPPTPPLSPPAALAGGDNGLVGATGEEEENDEERDVAAASPLPTLDPMALGAAPFAFDEPPDELPQRAHAAQWLRTSPPHASSTSRQLYNHRAVRSPAANR